MRFSSLFSCLRSPDLPPLPTVAPYAVWPAHVRSGVWFSHPLAFAIVDRLFATFATSALPRGTPTTSPLRTTVSRLTQHGTPFRVRSTDGYRIAFSFTRAVPRRYSRQAHAVRCTRHTHCCYTSFLRFAFWFTCKRDCCRLPSPFTRLVAASPRLLMDNARWLRCVGRTFTAHRCP